MLSPQQIAELRELVEEQDGMLTKEQSECLMQLTVKDKPGSTMFLYYVWPKKSTVRTTFGAWLRRERARIANNPKRVAAVVKTGGLESLYVNCVIPFCREHMH